MASGPKGARAPKGEGFRLHFFSDSGWTFICQSEGGTFRTAYSIPGRGNGAGWEQILHHHLVRRAPGGPPLL